MEAMRTRLITVHRAGGYLLAILFCIVAYSMSQDLLVRGLLVICLPTGSAYCACSCASAENIVRTPLQAESFVAEPAGWRGRARAVHRNHVIAMAIWTAPASVERDYSIRDSTEFSRRRSIVEISVFELLNRCRKPPVYIQKASRTELDA
jgi:hypothetical protein